ncbi:MAG: hypothetical protein QXX17_01565 [Conexivisphaerales archaeon]
MATESTSLFALYGMSITIPTCWRIELNPRSESEKGDVVFHTNSNDRFYISWGRLEEATSKFSGLEEHADYSIRRVKSGRDVESFQVHERYQSKVAGHDAIYTRIGLNVRAGIFGRNIQRKNIISLHFYCEITQRFFVIYQLTDISLTDMETANQQFKKARTSFSCHNH